MIDVFFRGRGDWILKRDGKEVTLLKGHNASGVFSLCEGDEIAYRHTKRLPYDSVSMLLPSSHEDSDLLRIVREGILDEKYSNQDCRFRIYEHCTEKLRVINSSEQITAKSTLRATELSTTERTTMLKLILGMAIDAYQYDPQSSRNKATGANKGSIHAALSLHGLSVDEDTIRKYLTEAAKLFPPKSQ
jgi:hypothetical protein